VLPSIGCAFRAGTPWIRRWRSRARHGKIHAMDNSRILICYDGTTGSERAIKVAAALLGPRRAVVLDVGVPITPAESLVSVSSVVPGQAFEELNQSDALERARSGAEFARHAGFDAEARSEISAPTWEGIVNVADEIDAPVIVIGSRGQSGARELFNGSVSHDVAAHAGRPVLVVPPADDH
jgi:nucleotide-binding universal stress UspA family protein